MDIDQIVILNVRLKQTNDALKRMALYHCGTVVDPSFDRVHNDLIKNREKILSWMESQGIKPTVPANVWRGGPVPARPADCVFEPLAL